MDTEKENKDELSRKHRYFAVFSLSAIAICAIAFFINDIFTRFNLPRPDPLVALVIEISIGVIIALVIFIESDRQQKKIVKLITEQEKFKKEQHDFAINRVRSYLASLHTAIKSLMEFNVDPNIPYTKEFEIMYDYKNDIISQLTFVVNQSGSILEQDYLQRLTDVIELARVNPKPYDDDYGTALDISHCAGIISQIEDLLKIIPNPAI